MKGFFLRDLYHIMVNAKFYALALVAMLIFGLAKEEGLGFMALYLMIFLSSALLGLFSYDEQNGWQAYAAAVPGGRKAQVDARYLLSLAAIGVVMALQLSVCLVSRARGQWPLMVLYTGMVLIYTALLFPLTYHFGQKSRFIMLMLVVFMAGVLGAGGAALVLTGDFGSGRNVFLPVAVTLVVIGAAAMVISHRISRHILAKKEF